MYIYIPLYIFVTVHFKEKGPSHGKVVVVTFLCTKKKRYVKKCT
jgi:ABC-type nickel/cobalt efflux system permease component RcnA